MTPTIEARGLIKRYGKTTALDGLDLVAEPGQVLAILGPNGAGKTTFVRAVATLLRPDGHAPGRGPRRPARAGGGAQDDRARRAVRRRRDGHDRAGEPGDGGP